MSNQRVPKKKEHYVSNKEFLVAMKEFKEKCKVAERKKQPTPPITDYIGECFLKIANHLSYRPNFINYTFKEDMISDGIENCLQYVKNFDPDKSDNPFAYFTQIIYYAFIRRIQKEKKQTIIKQKLIMKSGFDELSTQEMDNEEYRNQYADFLRRNMVEIDIDKTKQEKKKKKVKKPSRLEYFM